MKVKEVIFVNETKNKNKRKLSPKKGTLNKAIPYPKQKCSKQKLKLHKYQLDINEEEVFKYFKNDYGKMSNLYIKNYPDHKFNITNFSGFSHYLKPKFTFAKKLHYKHYNNYPLNDDFYIFNTNILYKKIPLLGIARKEEEYYRLICLKFLPYFNKFNLSKNELKFIIGNK